jgi:hypothetical protein
MEFCRMAQETQDSVTDQVGGGLVSGEEQQDRGRDEPSSLVMSYRSPVAVSAETSPAGSAAFPDQVTEVIVIVTLLRAARAYLSVASALPTNAASSSDHAFKAGDPLENAKHLRDKRLDTGPEPFHRARRERAVHEARGAACVSADR